MKLGPTVSIRFIDNDKEEFPFEVFLDCKWKNFADLISRSDDDTFFWSNPQDWGKYGREDKSTAMCCQKDLKSMLKKANDSNWEWVQVSDSEGQFPDSPGS